MDRYNNYIFSEILPKVISKYANNNAMGFVDEEAMTYAQMGEKIEATKAFAEALEIKSGDKVIIFSQNMPNWGIAYFALQCMGVIVVPVLPDFNKHELQNVLNHSEAKSIFISQSLEHKLADTNKDFLKSIVRLDNYNVLEGNKDITFDENAKCKNTYTSNENDMSVLLYTSGTTGNSKGVMLSQKNIIVNSIQADHIQKIQPNDKFLSVLPLSHTYENSLGLILPLLNGANITYLRKPPTASVLVPAMKSVKPDLMLTVPMIIEKVYRGKILPEIQKKTITRVMYKFKPTRKIVNKAAGKKLYQTFGGNLKFFGIGGAKLDGQVELFLREAKFPYAIGYGLTETAPILAGSNASMTRYQAIGPMVESCEVKIHNPDSKTGEGEIWAKGPNIMLGYYKNEESTKEVLTEDGWFRTGDLGVFDKDGWLSHKGRLKNMIVGANGENIYPEEIESLINNFAHVEESIVIEQKGKLVALVHFNREELEKKFSDFKTEMSNKFDEKIDEVKHKVDNTVEELAEELKAYINSRVNKVSRIQMLVVHNEPFKKTATKKIKRYLYY